MQAILFRSQRCFLRVLRFSPLLKNQHFQISVRPGKKMVDKEPLWEYALPKILIYLVIYLIGELTKRAESLFRF